MFNIRLPSQPRGTSHSYLLEERDIEQAQKFHVQVQHIEGFLPCRVWWYHSVHTVFFPQTQYGASSA